MLLEARAHNIGYVTRVLRGRAWAGSARWLVYNARIYIIIGLVPNEFRRVRLRVCLYASVCAKTAHKKARID